MVRKYWSRWGDALTEAGYQPNELQQPFDERRLLQAFASLANELGRFPVEGELRIKARRDKTFPSSGVFARLDAKPERARKLLDYCSETPGFDDVATICRPIVAEQKPGAPKEAELGTEPQHGHVHLARMRKYYKIGHTGSVGRRQYEIALQLPEKLTLVHSISTDDPLASRPTGTSASSVSAPREWFELRPGPSSAAHSCNPRLL